jgi:hypothetical protein
MKRTPPKQAPKGEYRPAQYAKLVGRTRGTIYTWIRPHGRKKKMLPDGVTVKYVVGSPVIVVE